MKLATFNVENMFQRAVAMNGATWADGKPALDDFAKLNTLIQADKYTAKNKADILKLMGKHKGLIPNGESKFITLRDIRGDFLKKKPAPTIIANGRADWIGWFELTTEPVKETATENTARIIDLVNADVLCVVEAENRTGLRRFNRDVLPKVNAAPYDHVMLIDGNDERGIDVGIMTRAGFEIGTMRSHVEDEDAKGVIFSRDCPEYEITTKLGAKLLVLVNHFKSKGYGSNTDEKRARQAKRVRDLYDARIKDGWDYIAIVGDLNELPDRAPLAPLVAPGDLTDIMKHASFVGDGRPGTHANGTKDGKLDYLLMSPKLTAKCTAGGIERRGVWGGKNGDLFPHLPTLKTAKDAASDHAALWADFTL